MAIRVFLSPERSMQVQRNLGADIVMVFDECTAHPATHTQARESMELSARWAARSRLAHADSPASLFGIVQGGMYADLRLESLERLVELGFDGYAIGGLSVGESKEEMSAVLDALLPPMPDACPRYLMGVGTPADLVAAVARGVDMFDCVLPTRNARNGYLFTSRGVVKIRNAAHRCKRCGTRCGVRLLHVSRIFARVPASPRSLRRNSRQRADDDSQPALLSDTDVSFARGN